MNLQNLIVDSISRSAVRVFSTMLNVELGTAEIAVENGTPEPNDGVVSFIGLAGSWAGTGSLTCSPLLACRICSQMLMTEITSVDEAVLDAVAELTNIIIGCVKTDLEHQLGPIGLSIPTVVFGRNFKTKSAGSTEWIVMRFQWDGELLLVKLCLAPNETVIHAVTQSAAQSCAPDVQARN
jgi:chemotaxis protein CheX